MNLYLLELNGHAADRRNGDNACVVAAPSEPEARSQAVLCGNGSDDFAYVDLADITLIGTSTHYTIPQVVLWAGLVE